MIDSVAGGTGYPSCPVVNPKGGGFVILERLRSLGLTKLELVPRTPVTTQKFVFTRGL